MAGGIVAATVASVAVLTSSGTAFASSVSLVTAAAAPGSAGATAQYLITFTATSTLAVGDTITIDEPAGTVAPEVSGDYTVNGHLLLQTPVSSGATFTLNTPVAIAAGSAVTVGAVNITNPPAGSYHVTVRTSADTTAASSATPYTITPASGSQVSNVTAVPLPNTAGAAATYTVSFTAKNALGVGGTITLVGPSGTVFPAAASSYTVNGHAASAASSGGSSVTITTAVGVSAGGSVTVQAGGVTNPDGGVRTLTVATSADSTPAASTFYTILGTSGGGGGGGGGGTPGAPAVTRVSGSDRFATAIAASKGEFPTAGSAGAVVLARSDNYPDALVGTALAAAKHAPLHFANGDSLTAETRAEITRVLPAGGTVYLLGGTTAMPASVATSVTNLGFVPVRYSGADRYGTALAVAAALGNPSTVLLATGVNFPDALAAGPAAAHLGGAVLLTAGTSLPASVQAYLAAHPGKVYAVGGPAAKADPSATKLVGADRYGTAVAVAAGVFGGPAVAGVASGVVFPDALSGGAYEAHFGGPMLLTDPKALPVSTKTYLVGSVGALGTVTVFGGTVAVSMAVQSQIGAALGIG
jgi:putative cell wall-binding protein